MNHDRTAIFTTTCKTCIFAMHQEGNQSDCVAGKLDIFLNKNRATKENGFYKIDGICQSCRNEEWLQKNNLHEEGNYYKIFSKIKEENRVTHDLIVNYCSDLGNLDKLLELFKLHDNVFDNIYIITESPDFKEIEKVIKFHYENTKFKIIMDILKQRDGITRRTMLNNTSFFCSIVDTSFRPELNYTKILNKYILDDINEVSLITGEGIRTVQVAVYNLLNNDTREITEKVKELCEIQKLDMTKTWEEICD